VYVSILPGLRSGHGWSRIDEQHSLSLSHNSNDTLSLVPEYRPASVLTDTSIMLPAVGVVVDVVVVVVVIVVVVVVVVVVIDVVDVVDVVVVVILHSTVFSLVDPAELSSQVLNVQVWTYPFVNLMFAQLTPHPSFPSLDRVAV